MARKTPPFEQYPEWTQARFWSFVRSALRQAHIRWPPAQKVMYTDRRTVTGKKHKFEHQCSSCKKWFPQKDIEKDHKVPTGTLKDFNDLPEFVRKLFVNEEGYRKVCKPCHIKITNGEKK